MLTLVLAAAVAQAERPPEWAPPHRYRVRLEVDPRGKTRSNSPASVDLDFPRLLKEIGASGELDESSLEVVGYDAAGRARGTLPVPWRLERYYGTGRVTLVFVVPDSGWTRFAAYFDTPDAGLGKPRRYPGLVGDGDRFREGFKRREINASHFDHFADLDGDGDLDLFKGGVEPYVHCYENVGGNRFVDRGRLTSGGSLFVLPASGEHRSWVTVAFHDWDGDGDLDFFPSFSDGPDAGKIVFYRNTTPESGGRLTFARVGPLATASGAPVAGGAQAGGWFPSVCFADWDGDGTTDLLVGSNNRCWLYRGAGELADAVALQAGGAEINLVNPRFDCADIDGDGDLDLFAGTQPGPIHLFKNAGTRTRPELEAGTVLAYGGKYLIGDAHSGVKVADFDGDGRLDLVAGRFWERTDLAEVDRPRDHGGLYRNVGTKTSPKFERRDESAGSPHTEGFQICDAVRQNGVRAVDWDGDGKTDLLAGDTDGFIWLFRRETGGVFAAGEKLRADGKPLAVTSSGGHARFDVCDWNNDGARDLVVADGQGTVTLFPGREGALAAGRPIESGGKPVQAGARASVLVCDWDNDGKKDLVLAGGREYLVCRNTGADANPVLAPARPITFEGGPVRYARPNLGSFVDWDGDGRRDLIGCHFENGIRFYRNLGTGAAGEEPRFTSPEGLVILQASSPQMISGADAVDWNGDGDLDLLTGQGHGASGLRFYERDYLNDIASGTPPLVTVRGAERR